MRDREEGVDPEGRREGTGKSSKGRDFKKDSFKMYRKKNFKCKNFATHECISVKLVSILSEVESLRFCAHREATRKPGMLNTQDCLFRGGDVDLFFTQKAGNGYCRWPGDLCYQVTPESLGLLYLSQTLTPCIMSFSLVSWPIEPILMEEATCGCQSIVVTPEAYWDNCHQETFSSKLYCTEICLK